MKKIKINIELPKASEIQRDLDNLIKQIDKNTSIKLNLDTSNFNKSLGEITQSIARLKTQVSNISGLDKIFETSAINSSTQAIEKRNQAIKEQQRIIESELSKTSNVRLINADGTETIIRDLRVIKDEYGNIIETVNRYNSKTGELTSTVVKTTNEIEKQRTEAERAMQSIEKTKIALQNKLNTSLNNKNFTLIDDKVFENLQNRINSINTNTSVREINELKVAINNLSSADSGIVRIQNAIMRLEERISQIKNNKLDIIDASEIAELKQAEAELLKLQSMMSQLQSGEVINGKAISNQINIASNSVRVLENQFKSTNDTAGGLSDIMKNISNYIIGGSAFYTSINYMKEAVNTTIELDTAMRDLKRVTDESQETYSNFMRTANETAIVLGTTTSGAIEATTTFSQLGYSFEESSEYLSKMAIILGNVGDMSASDSANSLVSILRGFRLEAEETTRIVDVLNESGNRFALTTADLAEGLRIGGSSLATANNDLEQASALIIAGTEVLRSSNTVAEGLKTISINKLVALYSNVY